MAIQKGKNGSIYVAYGSSIAATGEACEQESGTTYKISDISKRYWDKSQTVTVYENAVESTQAYNIEYPGGRIVFPSAPTEPVTVDCYYFNVARVAGCREFTLDDGYETVDVTEFNDGNRMRETILRNFSARLEKIKMDSMFSDPSDIADAFLFVFYEDLDVDTKIDPWVDGNFEIDDDSDGIGNGWSAHISGAPTGSRSLQSGGFAGAKFQRINITEAALDEEYGIEYDGLGNASSGDHLAVEFRYKTFGVTGLNITAKIGSTGTEVTFSTTSDWTRAVLTRKFTAITDMDVYIFFKATGGFAGSANLDIDFVRAIYLPVNNAQNRLEGYGRIATSLSVPVGDIGSESIAIEGDGGLYRRTDEVQL